MGEHVVVYITVPGEEVADRLAQALVGEGLAACVSRVPGVRSTYRWQGKVCVDDELLLVVKTRRALFEALRARVLALHPYEVPEVVALPIVEGHPAYLRWLEESTTPTTVGA